MTDSKDCSICNESTDSLEEQINASVIEMIKKNNPEWVETDGSCKKCADHYENLDQMVELDKQP